MPRIEEPYILCEVEDWYDLFFGEKRNTGIVVIEKQINSKDEFLCYLAMYWCPCGCGKHIGIPVNYDGHESNKNWGVSVDPDSKRVTFTPSIWTNKDNKPNAGCNSHYFITNGTVNWC